MTDRPPPDMPKKPRHRLRTMAGWNVFMDEQRATEPHRYVSAPDGLGASHLFVENVAAMLGCSVDHVRRIPRASLPAGKVGQRLIYARKDVENLIQASRDSGGQGYVADRKPRAGKAPVDDTPAGRLIFDPVAFARSLKKEPK